MTIELIVGPRFAVHESDLVLDGDGRIASANIGFIRGGLGPTQGGVFTIVADRMPISGPIIRMQRQRAPQRGMWFAHCLGCGHMSKVYKRKNEGMISKWASSHRCPPREVEYIGYAFNWTRKTT